MAYENLDDNHDDDDDEKEDDTHEQKRKDEKKEHTYAYMHTHIHKHTPHGRVTSSEWARGFVDPRGGVRTMNERVNEYNLCQPPLPPSLPSSVRLSNAPLSFYFLFASSL